MQKIVTVCFVMFFLVAGPSTLCQSSVSFFVKGTYNYFTMDDFKAFQHELRSDLTTIGIPAQITEQYLPFYGVQVGIMFPLEPSDVHTMFLGALLDYSSTGGRIQYQDYSGEVRNDHIAVEYSFGGILSKRILLSSIAAIDLSISA